MSIGTLLVNRKIKKVKNILYKFVHWKLHDK